MTQCTLYSEISIDEKDRNYYEGLIRKINFKNGGINIEVNLNTVFQDRSADNDKLMFFGGAILHQTNVTRQDPSIAGMRI